MGWEIDTDRDLFELIESLILDNYGHLSNEIAMMTSGDHLYSSLLTGIALGDRRTHSAFKRAHLSERVGEEALEYLEQTGIIQREVSRELPAEKAYPAQKLKKEIERHQISDKLTFSTPFLRFWFSFIAPLHREIEVGDYEKVRQRFVKREAGLNSLVFEHLSIELLKKNHTDDPIVEIGSYWDRQVEIDILAKTRSGKVIVAECKYTNTKVNRSELTKLKEKSQLADLVVDQFILFSKRGFSNELLSAQDENCRLYDLDTFSSLLATLSDEVLITGIPYP